MESHDEKGEIVETYYGPGTLLSIAAVYFGKESVRSYTAYTDCEASNVKT